MYKSKLSGNSSREDTLLDPLAEASSIAETVEGVLLVASMLLVSMRGAPSSVLAPSIDARSP